MSESNIQLTPGSIFICYRREDSADVTGRLYDRLADHFGPERVFIDVETIRLGYDFRSEIEERIKVCSIVIVIIGDEWLAQIDGKRRIDDENDRVRIEIEAAFRREIPIIPVLTRGASHPKKTMLPASLESLAYRHGTSIRHEHFRGDVDFLISQMDKLLARHESTPSESAKPEKPKEAVAEATPEDVPGSLAETSPQFSTRAAPAKLEQAKPIHQEPRKANVWFNRDLLIFVSKWTLACLLGEAVGRGAGIPVLRMMEPPPVVFHLGYFCFIGGAVGITQWVLLRRRIGYSKWWILSTSIGWVVGGLLMAYSTYPFLTRVRISAILTGFAVGMAQWVVLRRSVSRAASWVLIVGVAGGLGGAAGVNGVMLLSGQDYVTGWGEVGAISGVVSGIITGFGLGILLQRTGKGLGPGPSKKES